MKKNKFSAPNGAAVFLALSLILGGCGAGKNHIVAETAAAAAIASDYGVSFGMEAPMEEGYYDYETTLDTTSGGLADTSAASQTVSASRKLIRSVSMSVETDAFDQLIQAIQNKVTELSGYIEQSDISGNLTTYRGRYAYLTARIPSDKLDQFINLVEGSGNVTHKSESVQDITLQYSDLESRKKTLTVEQDRIWALLEKADTLEAVIALEERLSEIRYELESMESRLKLFDNQVEYSTIDISIDEMLPVDFTPTAPETVWERIQKGFTRNAGSMKDFAVNLFIALVILIPVWVPLAAIVTVAVILFKRFGKKGWRKRQKKSPVPEAETSSQKTVGQEDPEQGPEES